MYSSPSSSRSSFLEHEFEDLVSQGITAAKSGQVNLARSLLNRATMMKSADGRPWLWLSAVTDDPQEQRTCLERAVAADPNNAAAVRGLLILSGKLDPSRPAASTAQERRHSIFDDYFAEAQAQVFLCPKCGGRMSFDIRSSEMTCQYCGYIQSTVQRLAADAGEMAVAAVLPTARAHHWAEAQHRVSCEQCGAITLLAPMQVADCCPYCSSNRMIESAETMELVDPQVVALMKVDETAAYERLRRWLGRGLTVPDDLISRAGKIQLRPAYYPFWTFDGSVEVSWSCEVNVGSNDHPQWEPRTGVEAEFFDDVLVAGVRAMSPQETASIEPFNLKDLVEFQPEFLAGWPALTYNRSMSDASLLAREKVSRKMQSGLYNAVEPGQQKRDLRSGGGRWAGLTFKNVLLPLWVGTYQYQGKEFRVLVNGQTGKVGGKKPRDLFKVILLGIIGFILLVVLAAGLVWLLNTYGAAWFGL